MTPKNQHESTAQLRTQLRLILDEKIAFGPGKADLLDTINTTGSISGGEKIGNGL
jgi:molybdate transport system regulatory protein